MKLSLLACLAVGLLGLAGCSSSTETTTTTTPTTGSTTPGTLHVALVPAEDAEKMAEGFEPIRAKLEKDIGEKVEVTNVTDYASVIEAMRAGKLDVAWFGPLAMVFANEQTGAIPFAVPDIEGTGMHYFSLWVAKSDSGIKTLNDLKGKKVALVDPGSTSGNLIPRSALMKSTGKTVEDYCSQMVYAGSHDASLLALKSGSVDACAVQDITFNSMVEKKEIDPTKFTILYKSDPLPQSPIGARKDLDPALLKKIEASFYGFGQGQKSQDVPGMGKIVKFVPTSMTDFKAISDTAKELHLTNDLIKKK